MSNVESTIAPSYRPIQLFLPVDVLEQFEREAKSDGRKVEQAIVQHISKTLRLHVEQGRILVINPEDRQQIERDFSRSFKDSRELAHYLGQVYSIKVGGVTVQLSPDLLKRMEGRRGRMEFEAFVKETVIRQLEHFVGLR